MRRREEGGGRQEGGEGEAGKGEGGRGMADHESELSQRISGFYGFRVRVLGFRI